MRGRRPTPSAIKALNGNPGKRAINKNEPKPATTMPECPDHLDDEAKREWDRISKELHAAGLLTTIDRAALATYCTAWSRWVDAENQLRKHGAVVKSPSGYPIQNPYLSIANKAMTLMQKALVEFGMTPSSRSRISTEPSGEATDEIEAFLKLTG